MIHIRAVICGRAALFTAALALSAVPSLAQSPVQTSNLVQPSVSIDNFGRINAHYYRGAQPLGNDFQDLATLGVKTIIDLTSDDGAVNEQAMTEAAGMRFVKIPMTTREEPTTAELEKFLSIVNDPAAQPVYVHCVGGRHRTGVMTAIYRITSDGWTGEQAFKEMKQYKYGADFLHPEFKKFVLAYKTPARTVADAVATIE